MNKNSTCPDAANCATATALHEAVRLENLEQDVRILKGIVRQPNDAVVAPDCTVAKPEDRLVAVYRELLDLCDAEPFGHVAARNAALALAPAVAPILARKSS